MKWKLGFVFLWFFLCPPPTTNAITVDDFYPFITGEKLTKEIEDGSSQEIPLKNGIAFYGTIYNSIFVNMNGMLSFLTEIPSFYNIQFPMNYPVIAALYSDVDARGRGDIFYEEIDEEPLLLLITEEIRKHFSYAQEFQAKSAFVATWHDVGYYNNKTDKGNTFQVVLITDGENSYAQILYADNGIQWIQSEGKTPGLPDAKAQAAFMSGDERMYTLHGSGSDHARNLNKLSNVGTPGVWFYHIGKLAPGENVGSADQNIGEAYFSKSQTCAQLAALCHTNARCVDYETGFCCECDSGHFGNGQTCLANDEPQRVNGKVTGILNGAEIGEIDLHSYVVVSDGRQYTAVSKISPNIGFDVQSLNTIGGIIGWLFGVPKGKAKNGFQLTGGVFNRTVDIEFPQTGHQVQIKQQFTGVDAFNYLRVQTDIRGTVPIVPTDSQLEMDDYYEEYNRVLPGMIRSQTTHTFKLDGNNVETPYKQDQIITFDECEHSPRDTETDTLRLRVARNFITYDTAEKIVRYANTNKMSTLGTDDPCKEGRQQCGPNSSCIVEGDTFRCICNPGYEYYFEDDVNGERATCIDINECTTGKDNCHAFAECINQLGSFRCTCLAGYTGDGTSCKKTLSCEDLQCHADAECVTVGPSQVLECRCKEGFRGNGIQCEPIQDQSQDCILQPEICDPNAECVTIESEQQHVCRCLAGWRGDGYICIEDDDDVSCNILNNCHPHAHCAFESTDGKYVCRCNAGYDGDGFTCSPLDVTCDQVDICSIHGQCLHDRVQNTHVCICNEGYEGDGRDCNAIDECSSPSDCDVNAQCLFDNSALRYKCLCNSGYAGTGRECSVEPTGGETGISCNVRNNCDSKAQCIYDESTSKHKCQCETGFYGDGITCRAAASSCNVINNCDANADCVQDPLTQAFQCLCREGFVGDGLNCILGRQCLNDPSVCDPNAECIYVTDIGQHLCQCVQGYIGDGHTCTEAPKFEGNFLVSSQGMSLVRTPLQESRNDPGKPIIMQPLQTAVGVDADCTSGHLYWADVSGKAIKKSNYDGSNIEVFIDVDIESPEGVAVDWISRNIFWTDSLKDTIQVARLDSPNRDRKIIIETDLSNPRGIAVHPTRGILFWSDWNRLKPKIETANMDGTARTLLVFSELELPNSLTIDFDREELCWADAGTKRIECCSLEGENRRTIVSALLYPFGLANSRQNFYWTDWESRKIEILNKTGGQRETPIEPPLGGSGKLYGLAIVPERCPRASNPCSVQNGGCRYLCLPKGYGGRTCACPDYTLDGEEPVCNEI